MMQISATCVLVVLITGVELVQVKVEQGMLEGEILTTIIGNRTYYSFKGIPYAAPPVGSLRFKAPEPPFNWTGIRDATSHCASCPQKDIVTSIMYPGNEDCLCLNVYTTNLKYKSPLPVIVFIHGGGFKSGSGNTSSYGPDFLMNHNVVLVTINYRLEALGFLSLDTEEVPGNAGLKDQVAALFWVKNNIAKFGGNPSEVTIMGQSAGSASVAYHILSPMSKGLFKRAIGLSGVPLCDFAIEYKPIDRAFVLGKQLGINTKNKTELLIGLQRAPVDKLYNTNCNVLIVEEEININIKSYQFVPVIENDFGKNNTFISKHVIEIIKNGNINVEDVIFGYTGQELVSVSDIINSTYLKLYDTYPEMFTPTKILLKNKPDVNLEVASRIRNFYFGDAALNMREFIMAVSDSMFAYDIIRFLSMLPIQNKYLYKFTMTSGLNFYGNQANKYGIFGDVGHLDDLNYLFATSFLNTSLLKSSNKELQLVNQFCTLITNFVKYGNPTQSDIDISPQWPLYDTTTKSYMEIGNTLSVGTPEADMLNLWKNIYDYVGMED